jgi:predicted ATPase
VRDADGYGLRVEQFADHALELVKAQVDVIVAVGDAAIRAAQLATKTIPILANGTDLVRAGFVASLAKPGGNITGFSILAADLDGKAAPRFRWAHPRALLAACEQLRAHARNTLSSALRFSGTAVDRERRSCF